MHLYSTLLQADMITTTRVAESQQTVTGDGKQLMLGDKLRRVTDKAKFVTDPGKWRPSVKKDLPKKVPTVTPAAQDPAQ
jgi:defect-in-organelle-trafficking protein DotC